MSHAMHARESRAAAGASLRTPAVVSSESLKIDAAHNPHGQEAERVSTGTAGIKDKLNWSIANLGTNRSRGTKSRAAGADDNVAATTSKSAVRTNGLQVSRPGDGFELEAERMAEEVLADRGPGAAWSLSRMRLSSPAVQRECSCGGTCEDCKKRDEVLRREAGPGTAPEFAPAAVHNVLRGRGQQMDGATRNYMETRFGYDFGRVRIYNDDAAANSARDVSANAYTVGEKVVFNSGKYAPESEAGRRLLAHELAHVVQQTRGQVSRTVQRQHCAHDGTPTKCGATRGTWKLVDQVTNESGLFSIDDLVIEGGLKSLSGTGEWVRQVQTPPNLAKNEKAERGRVDGARVSVGSTLEVEVVEVKARSDDGGGCSRATFETNGYVGELRTLAPLIVPMAAKLAAAGGMRVDSGKCKTPKTDDKKALEAAGVDFNNASSVNAWCFYNSLQERLNRTFRNPFTAVNIRANGDGQPGQNYDVKPPVVINCKKTKANPTGVGLRFLQFQVNGKGGVSYGCRDVCRDEDNDEKRKEKTVEERDDQAAFRDADKYNRLDLPDDAPNPNKTPPQRKKPDEIRTVPQGADPDVTTTTSDTGEDKPVNLPHAGVSDLEVFLATVGVITSVAWLHQALKAKGLSVAEKAAARALIEDTIEKGAQKGAVEVGKRLDSHNLAKYGTEAGDVLLKETDEAVVIAAKRAPGLLARLGPKGAKFLGKVGPIIGIVLLANDARAAISHIRKGGTIELGPSLDDVDLKGDTRVKNKGPDETSKPTGDVALKDTVIDIETKTALNVSGKADIQADKVTIKGAATSDGSPVTVNIKAKLNNTTITFKNNGVVQNGKVVTGHVDISDSQIEYDLPPGTLDPGRQGGETRTITGAKITVTSLASGDAGNTAGRGQSATPGANAPAQSATPGGGGGTQKPTATPAPVTPAPLAGADRPKLIKQIDNDPDLRKLYIALTGKEGVIPSDEVLRRFIALKETLQRHPAESEKIIAALKPGTINDPVKDIIEPIEQALDQEDEKLKTGLEQAATNKGKPGSTPGTPGAAQGSEANTTKTDPGKPGAAPETPGATQTPTPGPTTGPTQQPGTAAPTARPNEKVVSIAFKSIERQLVLPSYEFSEKTPPKTYIYYVEWQPSVNGKLVTYSIPLSLTLHHQVPNPGSFVWQADYTYFVPGDVIPSEGNGLPIRFSDAGGGPFTKTLYVQHPNKLK